LPRSTEKHVGEAVGAPLEQPHGKIVIASTGGSSSDSKPW
jgi:hypothetical protein